MIKRTNSMAIAAGAILAAVPVAASAETLTVLSHPVFRAVIEGTETSSGGNVLDTFLADKRTSLNWLTLDIAPLHDRLFRELSLAQTSVDIAFIHDRYATKANLALFAPLESCNIEGFDDYLADIPASMRELASVDGAVHVAAFRHATHALFYNEAILEERGIADIPTDIEGIIALARELSFTRDDGTVVNGMTLDGNNTEATANFLLAFGGHLYDADGKPTANSTEMVAGLTALRALYEEGVLPQNLTALGIDDQIAKMRNGTAAMTIQPFARSAAFNDASASNYPGQILPLTIAAPADANVAAAATTVVWSVGIPRNAQNFDLSCQFVAALISEEGTVRAALNGNGPTRLSAYTDPRLLGHSAYAETEEAALRDSDIPFPATDNTGRAVDLYVENVQAAILGLKSPQQAADELQSGLERLAN